MRTVSHLGEHQNLLKHMEWADALIWKAVLSLQGAQHDRRLLELLHHIHTVQWVYLHVWRGEAPDVPEHTEFADLAAVAAWARPCYAGVRSFVEGLREDDLAREVALPWTDDAAKALGSAGSATLSDTLLQVALHSAYHRAQVAARIRELGHEPPLTDFIAWVWRQRPEAAW